MQTSSPYKDRSHHSSFLSQMDDVKYECDFDLRNDSCCPDHEAAVLVAPVMVAVWRARVVEPGDVREEHETRVA